MLTPEIKNHFSLDELNRKADTLFKGLRPFNPTIFKQNLNDFLDDLEVVLPGGPGITPNEFISKNDHQTWRGIHKKLKEIGRLHPEGLSKRYYRLMIVIVLHAGISDDFFSSKI